MCQHNLDFETFFPARQHSPHTRGTADLATWNLVSPVGLQLCLRLRPLDL